MKKILAITLAVMMLISMATVVSAASTTLTTTVPAATYTLNIPANQEIAFGATTTKIGTVTVTDSEGFAAGKNLAVTVTYDAFKCENVTTTIPFSLATHTDDDASTPALENGGILKFEGTSSGAVEQNAYHKITYYGSVSGALVTKPIENILLVINSSYWSKALAGEYTATITFTAEVVVE